MKKILRRDVLVGQQVLMLPCPQQLEYLRPKRVLIICCQGDKQDRLIVEFRKEEVRKK